MNIRVLVVAKAPVAGRVKTRLGAEIGMERAADLAVAALIDTLRTCVAAVGVDRCRLALEGDLADTPYADRLAAATDGWVVFPQRGDALGDRLAQSMVDLADEAPGPVVQVAMDTPQVEVADLTGVVGHLACGSDAVVADAEDGGWWALALADPRHAEHVRGVPTSTPTTGVVTRRALEAAGLRVHGARMLRDVDTAADAAAVAAACPPGSEFARAWRQLR
jgi:glycosyltransferase A (GT-A) superfamily protein (DUF2064 family)